MREPRNYEALRTAERRALTEKHFVDAGREATVRVELPSATADHQIQSVESPFLTHEERHEVARAALFAELDAKVHDNKIDSHERQYEMQRFENGGLRPQNDPAGGHEQPRTSSRGLGMMDRADMVSQQAAARERLNQGIDRGAAGHGPDQDPDQSRKSPDIER